MKKYLTPLKGLILPGSYNYDGPWLFFLRKDRVKRLFHTYSLPYSWMHFEFGLNAITLDRKKNLCDRYRPEVINLLIDNYHVLLNKYRTKDFPELAQTWCLNKPAFRNKWLEVDNQECFHLLEFYSQIDQSYVGDAEQALMLLNLGIAPEKADKAHKVCSIGFCEEKQAWYSWSHRAMTSFSIGHKITKESAGYRPTDEKDFCEQINRFWSDDSHWDVQSGIVEEDGERLCYTTWTYVDLDSGKSKSHGVKTYLPKTWGRGEWTASTLDDAKQMAIDFAEAVS